MLGKAAKPLHMSIFLNIFRVSYIFGMFTIIIAKMGLWASRNLPLCMHVPYGEVANIFS
jgi:hypothetical protein